MGGGVDGGSRLANGRLPPSGTCAQAPEPP